MHAISVQDRNFISTPGRLECNTKSRLLMVMCKVTTSQAQLTDLTISFIKLRWLFYSQRLNINLGSPSSTPPHLPPSSCFCKCQELQLWPHQFWSSQEPCSKLKLRMDKTSWFWELWTTCICSQQLRLSLLSKVRGLKLKSRNISLRKVPKTTPELL